MHRTSLAVPQLFENHWALSRSRVSKALAEAQWRDRTQKHMLWTHFVEVNKTKRVLGSLGRSSARKFGQRNGNLMNLLTRSLQRNKPLFDDLTRRRQLSWFLLWQYGTSSTRPILAIWWAFQIFSVAVKNLQNKLWFSVNKKGITVPLGVAALGIKISRKNGRRAVHLTNNIDNIDDIDIQ